MAVPIIHFGGHIVFPLTLAIVVASAADDKPAVAQDGWATGRQHGLLALAGSVAVAEGKPKLWSLDDVIPQRAQSHQKHNGCLLNATATGERKRGGIELTVNWTIEYDGPRPPLTILVPDPTMPTGGQTELHYLYPAPDGKPVFGQVSAPPGEGGGPPDEIVRRWFVTAKKGQKAVTGTFKLTLEDFGGPRPERHLGPNDPLYIQIFHKPVERGYRFTLDAWTGQIVSKPVRVEFLPK